jgi:hypothetical protein
MAIVGSGVAAPFLRQRVIVSWRQCPVCFGPLEVRTVTPCDICGDWRVKPEEELLEGASFAQCRLPDGQILTLCSGCLLEDFTVPGGLGNRLNLPPAPQHALHTHLTLVRTIEHPELGKDKFCPACNLRLAFLKIIASRAG